MYQSFLEGFRWFIILKVNFRRCTFFISKMPKIMNAWKYERYKSLGFL